jgi:hypothetical protein
VYRCSPSSLYTFPDLVARAWLGIGTDVTVEAFTEFDEFYSGNFLPGNPDVLAPIVFRQSMTIRTQQL